MRTTRGASCLSRAVDDPDQAESGARNSLLSRGFLRGETFRDLAEMQAPAVRWCRDIAGPRVHGTARQVPRVVSETAEQTDALAASRGHDGPELTFCGCRLQVRRPRVRGRAIRRRPCHRRVGQSLKAGSAMRPLSRSDGGSGRLSDPPREPDSGERCREGRPADDVSPDPSSSSATGAHQHHGNLAFGIFL